MNMTSVTVAANMRLTVVVGGWRTTYLAAATVLVPTYIVARLRSEGVIV